MKKHKAYVISFETMVLGASFSVTGNKISKITRIRAENGSELCATARIFSTELENCVGFLYSTAYDWPIRFFSFLLDFVSCRVSVCVCVGVDTLTWVSMTLLIKVLSCQTATKRAEPMK